MKDLKHSGQVREQVQQILSYLVKDKPLTFEECIVWARLQFEEKFNNDIQQLLYSLPKDAVTSSGQPFWSGPKRAPDPLTFDPEEVCYFILHSPLSVTDYFNTPSSQLISNLSFRLLIYMRIIMASGGRQMLLFSKK